MRLSWVPGSSFGRPGMTSVELNLVCPDTISRLSRHGSAGVVSACRPRWRHDRHIDTPAPPVRLQGSRRDRPDAGRRPARGDAAAHPAVSTLHHSVLVDGAGAGGRRLYRRVQVRLWLERSVAAAGVIGQAGTTDGGAGASRRRGGVPPAARSRTGVDQAGRGPARRYGSGAGRRGLRQRRGRAPDAAGCRRRSRCAAAPGAAGARDAGRRSQLRHL